MPEEVELAAAVYRCFERWMRINENGLGGRLLLVSQAAFDEIALIRAASIAGTATLVVGESASQARALARDGVCDFLVTHLDEALRILKNELRRRQPVAVYLHAQAADVLADCKVRGVQPDFVTEPEPVLLARGARLVGCSSNGGLPTRPERPQGSQLVSWTAPARSWRMLASLDAMALAAVGPLDHAQRQRWLERSPQYLGRKLANWRFLPMEAEERMRFVAAVQSGMASMHALADVRIWRGDEPLL